MHIPTAFLLIATLAASLPGGSAQANRQFRARLSTVPIDLTMQNVIAGSGTATATLAGNKLTVNGTFGDLKSPATVARIHVAPRGMGGPAQLDLQVTPGTSGTITGSFDLTPAQVQDLTNQRFYIQLHSEKAPDGNLRGWLLPQENRR
jgi:CHRD domain-containing protein